ncbi:dysbindin-A-like isoform X2 [Salvelinus fontinalis]|uniref:dysbindin-A-like isoform X2 n=1 Tax=Salvelinus fontinalis TaxID=8038 RepID=UPI002485E70C|nr:dysbindin-A-like isoform X2 [Salvelinus fontinalis]
MFENFKERLQTVQQDFTTGMKTLSDKSKEAKVKPKQRHEHLTQFSAGVELLSRYEDTWVTLHRKAKDCAKAGQTVDGEVVMLSAHWEKRRAAVVELQEQLQQIPGFLTDLETCTNRIAHLEADFEELESRLMYLDNLCGQCEQQRFRHFQVLQLENYKKKKRKELESLKAELDSEHAQKVLDMEHAQQGKLKERQKYFEEAFQQDMDQYLSTGYLQITDRRGSMSSMEVNVDVLEQMDLMDVSDHEALDVFLNSGGEDNSLTSSLTSGPDPESLSSEISLRVPTQADLRYKPSSFSSTEPGSASQDTSQDTSLGEGQEGEGSEASGDGDQPLVLPDEEEVQADTALVSLPEAETFKNSDDSDSQAS